MGTWDVGAFGNDEALDWSDRLVRARSWRPVVDALARLDVNDASSAQVALAAAEVVASSLGLDGDDVPDVVPGFLQRVQPCAPAVVHDALTAVARVRTGGDLRALWEDGDATPWLAALADLEQRLNGVPRASPTSSPDTRPRINWASAATQELVSTLLGQTVCDWVPVGRVLLSGWPIVGRATRAQQSLAMAAAEIVAAALGAPLVDLPDGVAAWARRAGVPSMFVIRLAVGLASNALADARARGGSTVSQLVGLRCRLTASGDEETSLAWLHDHDVRLCTIVQGARRRQLPASGAAVAVQLPEGWICGRVVPLEAQSLTQWWAASRRRDDRACMLWLDRELHVTSDAVPAPMPTGACWVRPHIVEARLFLEGWVTVLDGVPPDVRAEAWTAEAVQQRPRGLLFCTRAADRLPLLESELRYRARVGWDAHLRRIVEWRLIHGVTQQVPGARPEAWLLRHGPLRNATEDAGEPELLTEIDVMLNSYTDDDVQVLRRAWIPHATP